MSIQWPNTSFNFNIQEESEAPAPLRRQKTEKTQKSSRKPEPKKAPPVKSQSSHKPEPKKAPPVKPQSTNKPTHTKTTPKPIVKAELKEAQKEMKKLTLE